MRTRRMRFVGLSGAVLVALAPVVLVASPASATTTYTVGFGGFSANWCAATGPFGVNENLVANLFCNSAHARGVLGAYANVGYIGSSCNNCFGQSADAQSSPYVPSLVTPATTSGEWGWSTYDLTLYNGVPVNGATNSVTVSFTVTISTATVSMPQYGLTNGFLTRDSSSESLSISVRAIGCGDGSTPTFTTVDPTTYTQAGTYSFSGTLSCPGGGLDTSPGDAVSTFISTSSSAQSDMGSYQSAALSGQLSNETYTLYP